MTETLSPGEAARVLVDATRFEGAIRARTEGLTWIVWGIVTPAIFLTYAFADLVGARGWWVALLWAPWVACGVLATVTMWRSVALAMPGLSGQDAKSGWFWLRFAAFNVAFIALFFLLRPTGPEVPLMVVGGMWAGMGVLNFWGADGNGRVGAIASGLPLVATGIALSLLDAPVAVGGTLAIVVSGAAPIAVGIWLTLRG